MADDNRFAGISEQLGEGSDDEDATEDSTEDSEVGASDSAETPDSDATASEPDVEEDVDESGESDEGGPAFSFETTAQTSIYPRTETARDTLDDVEFEVEGVLRRNHDVRDLAGRELHDAMIRLAAERPEEVADLVVQLRDDE
jgi:hypothetical protein